MGIEIWGGEGKNNSNKKRNMKRGENSNYRTFELSRFFQFPNYQGESPLHKKQKIRILSFV